MNFLITRGAPAKPDLNFETARRSVAAEIITGLPRVAALRKLSERLVLKYLRAVTITRRIYLLLNLKSYNCALPLKIDNSFYNDASYKKRNLPRGTCNHRAIIRDDIIRTIFYA